MTELRDELFAVPVSVWQIVPITANHHKWWLRWYRFDKDGRFFFEFASPRGRRYCFFVERGTDGGRGRVTYADVEIAHGETIASYWDVWGDTAKRLDAVIRLTPRHIIDRLHLLLDAIAIG